MERETLVIQKGERKSAGGISIGFESADSADVNISFNGIAFQMNSRLELGEMSMMSQAVTPAETRQTAKAERDADNISKWDKNCSAADACSRCSDSTCSKSCTSRAPDRMPLFFIFQERKDSSDLTLWDMESEQTSEVSDIIDGKTVEISYGSKITNLPFSIKLNDFILERYPGSNSPSGYKSDVVLIDKTANIEKPFMIFMNNILKYKGYRFYQSSFDRDEQGTILSVNHDRAGMFVTYTGYIMLIIFMVLSLINKNALFHNITAGFWNSTIRKSAALIVLILFFSGLTALNAQKLIPDRSAAQEFGKVLVQDQKGRTKPLFTLSNDILRKVTRENDFEGLTSMQVFLGLYLDFENWKDVPLIRISNQDIQQKLGIQGKYAAFSDIVNLEGNGDYKLSEDVNKAYAKAPGDRSKSDKEMMKIDERMNIVYMIYKGEFLKLFPLKNGTHDWGLPENALAKAINKDDSLYLKTILPLLDDAIKTNNISTTRQITESISGYQKRFSEYDLPSGSKTNAELLYYKLGIFERLFPFYATVGLIMLIALITMVIRGSKKKSLFVNVLGWLLFTGFLFHTFGLATQMVYCRPFTDEQTDMNL